MNSEEYGFTVSDNYMSGYDWLEEKPADDDLEFIKQVQSHVSETGSPELLDLFSYIEETESGVHVDGAFLEYLEIRQLFD